MIIDLGVLEAFFLASPRKSQLEYHLMSFSNVSFFRLNANLA